jgi:hypothetical protein
MSYEALREYITTLYKAASIDEFHQMLIHDIRIHWPSINILYLESAQKHDYAGLQLADFAAGGIRAALEKNHFGNTEHRYAKTIRPAVYSRRSKYSSYGMKFFPGPPHPEDGCAHWINKHYK